MNRPPAYLFFFVLLCIAPIGAQQSRDTNPVTMFRSLTPPPGWHPSDSLRIFQGEELYRLIDGGADVYSEYGFTLAGSRRYSSPEGNEIDIEIYEMRDPDAAYGIYSFLAAESGTPVPLGQEGVGSDGFLLFQKARFVISLTALAEGEQAALIALGRAVDSLIVPGGQRPDLVDALLRPNFRNTGVVAIRGSISFDQRSRLGLGNLFRIREGAGGLFDGCRTFILRYPGSAACDSAESQGVYALTSEGGYRQVSANDTARLLAQPGGSLIHSARSGRHLLLTMGEGREKVQRVAFMLGRVALKPR
jgi:hypothetical protein